LGRMSPAKKARRRQRNAKLAAAASERIKQEKLDLSRIRPLEVERPKMGNKLDPKRRKMAGCSPRFQKP
jgi:hypothetical protein